MQPATPLAQPLSRYSAGELYLVVTGGQTAARQRSEGFRYRADMLPWPLRLPLDWAASEAGNWNWNVQLHSWRMMDPCLAEWLRGGDPALLAEAFGFARDWWRRHADGTRLRHSWYDMAVGIRALRLALFLEQRRRGRLVLDAADDAALAAMVDRHAAELLDPATLSHSNHAIFQAMGLRILAEEAADRPALAGAAEAAGRMMAAVIAGQFTAEGIHREHSPGYHLFVTGLVERLRLLRWFPALHDMAEVLRRAAANRDWLFFPDGRVARIGDTRHGDDIDPPPPPRPIAGPGGTRRVAGRRCELSGFAGSGWTIARAWSADETRVEGMVFMTAMQHGAAHKHADELSFELFERGRRILVDAGHYAFSPADAMKLYVLSAAAHNTVDLLERPLTRGQTRSYGAGLHAATADGEAVTLSGEVLGRGRRFDHARSLRWVPGRSLEIRDRLRQLAPGRLTFASRLHLAPDLQVAADGTALAVTGPEGRIATIHPPAGAALRIRHGETDPPLGWTTIGYGVMAPVVVLEALWQADAWDSLWRIELAPAAA